MKKIVIYITVIILSAAFSFGQTNMIQIGTEGHDVIYDLAIDDEHNTYATGFFQGTLNSHKARGDSDMFIAKYNSDRSLMWSKQLGSDLVRKREISEFGKFIALDKDRNSYVLGLFQNKFRFLNKEIISRGKQDVFLVKYNDDGDEQWISTLGTSNNESIKELIVDEEGNAFIVVRLEDSKKSSAKRNKIYKFNSAGHLLWSSDIILENPIDFDIRKVVRYDNKINILVYCASKNFMVVYDNEGNKVREVPLTKTNKLLSFAIDNGKNIYAVGVGLNTRQITNYFVIYKINSKDGNIVWEKRYNNAQPFKPKNIQIRFDELYITGAYKEHLNSIGSKVLIFDESGSYISERTFSGENQNRINKVLIKGDQFYLAGQFYKEMEFNKTKTISSVDKIDSYIDIQKILLNEDEDLKIYSENAKIYPNPNNGEFYISNIESVLKIIIYDQHGRLVLKRETIKNPRITIKGLESAIYNVALHMKNGEINFLKLIII